MRPSEDTLLDTEDSRCGEIFVSNKADKWTFYCSYCQKGTSDIGVFVCHIRLDHLASLLDYGNEKENVTPEEEGNFPETETQLTGTLLGKGDERETDITLIKEETLSQTSFDSEPVPTKISKNLELSSLTDNSETENVLSVKNSISSGYPTIEINEEYFTITSKDPDVTEEDSLQGNHEIVRVLYGKNEEKLKKSNDETIANDDIEDIYTIDTNSVYSVDDDDDDLLIKTDIDFENIDDNKASSSKRRKEDRNIAQHICDFCNMSFKLRSELDYHLKKIHNQKLCEMPLKCKECRKVFRSIAGYKNHLNSHDERNQKQCPICKARHNLNYFITHVMGHESNTCFPCMVCGKIFSNHAERMQHWGIHAKDKPYACDLCFRRFRQKHFLLHHLKSHGQYRCYFCPEKFVTSKTPRPPYVCPKCEKLPDIGQKIEHHKLFANKNYVNESEEEQTSSSGFCSTQSEEFFSRKSGEPDPEQNVLQLNQKTNKTKRVPTKTTKLREDFARRSSDSEPDLKRFNTGQENEEFLSITNESNHVAQEIFIINSEDIDQETGCKTNKSNNETISIDAEKDFPTTTSSIHQKDEKITSESTNTEISMLKKLPLQQQQMRLSPDVIILEEVAETPDVTLESLGMPPINVEQTITSVMDQQQKDDISTEEHSAVTEKTSSDDSTNKRSIRMVNACSCCKDDNKDKRYKCALCELTFLTKNLLNIHIAETHKGTISKTRFECKDCCRSFGHLSALKYHLENFHKFLISRTNFKEYYLVSYGLVPDKIITQFKCQYCLTLQDIGRQKPPYICTNCGSSPKRYRTSFDSIPKAQIKTKRSLP